MINRRKKPNYDCEKSRILTRKAFFFLYLKNILKNILNILTFKKDFAGEL